MTGLTPCGWHITVALDGAHIGGGRTLGRRPDLLGVGRAVAAAGAARRSMTKSFRYLIHDDGGFFLIPRDDEVICSLGGLYLDGCESHVQTGRFQPQYLRF